MRVIYSIGHSVQNRAKKKHFTKEMKFIDPLCHFEKKTILGVIDTVQKYTLACELLMKFYHSQIFPAVKVLQG